MGIVDEFERRLEKAVEGVFSKAFRSDLEPAEIGRRLMREMEGGKSVSVGAVYVPNSYKVLLSDRDYERFEGLFPTLSKEFGDLLVAVSRERRWKLAGPLAIEFAASPAVRERRFEVEAAHTQTEGPEIRMPPTSTLALASDGSQSWKLDADETTIGRALDCAIVITDPNASRQHAQVQRRGDEWWLVDLDSTNGTLVNDSLVKERRLRTGDVIKIGSTDFKFDDSLEG